jgi:putative Mn2+ efflux pump MntP
MRRPELNAFGGRMVQIMWRQYRKSFLANQTIAVTVCIVVALATKADTLAVGIVAATMEIGLLLGAAWLGRGQRDEAAAETDALSSDGEGT